MDQKPVRGDAERVKGSIKEAIGKLTGDTRAQAEGRAQKGSGKAQIDTTGAEGEIPDVTRIKT